MLLSGHKRNALKMDLVYLVERDLSTGALIRENAVYITGTGHVPSAGMEVVVAPGELLIVREEGLVN